MYWNKLDGASDTGSPLCWIVTLDVLKSFSPFWVTLIIMLNSNIRCIEMRAILKHPKRYKVE